MARLRKCKDCGHQISKSADACPNCGRRLRRRWNEIGPLTTFLIFGIILLFFLAALSSEASEYENLAKSNNFASRLDTKGFAFGTHY